LKRQHVESAEKIAGIYGNSGQDRMAKRA